jgi:DNA-directed RNA polymerase specialized sigma24 family protein
MTTDNESWNAIRNDDRSAFTDIYKTYYQFLFVTGFKKCANRELAKDCIHEMFLEIWKKRKELPPVQHVGYYLKTYLVRKILRELPKEQHLHVATNDDDNLSGVELPYEDLII